VHEPHRLQERLRRTPELLPEAVPLYDAYLELDRNDGGEPTTASMFLLLEKVLGLAPASAEARRARRLWRDMRHTERDFHDELRKREKDKRGKGRKPGDPELED